MRRLLFPGLAAAAAVALVALLVFGVAGQGTDSSIDAAIAHGRRPAAPAVRPVAASGSARLHQPRIAARQGGGAERVRIVV
jgi:hypothetical protein